MTRVLNLQPPEADRERFAELQARFAAKGHLLRLAADRTYLASVLFRTSQVNTLDEAERLLLEKEAYAARL